MRGRFLKITTTNGTFLHLSEVEVFDTKGNNVAFQKTTRMSSVGWGGTSDRGVDGEYGKTWFHTQGGVGEWWIVDFGEDVDIVNVLLHNRLDQKGRIKGAKVEILDVAERPVSVPKILNKIQAVYEFTPEPVPSETPEVESEAIASYVQRTLAEVDMSITGIIPEPEAEPDEEEDIQVVVIGRYIRLTNTTNNFLNVALVEVFNDKKEEIAKGKQTEMSSEYNAHYSSEKGVDGSMNTIFHTKKGLGEWWELDLGADMPISMVKIHNRSDCCRDRIKGCVLQIFDSDRMQISHNQQITDTRNNCLPGNCMPPPIYPRYPAAPPHSDKTSPHTPHK